MVSGAEDEPDHIKDGWAGDTWLVKQTRAGGGGGGGHPSSGLSEVAVERNEGGVDDDAEEYNMWISAAASSVANRPISLYLFTVFINGHYVI